MKHPVGRAFAFADIKFFFKFFQNLVIAFQITGGSGTDRNNRFAGSIKLKEIIKGQNFINPGQRDSHFFGNLISVFPGHIAFNILNFMESHNQ